MIIKKEIFARSNEFKTICENHSIKYLYAFGSATNNSFDQNTSDIDLLVEIDNQDPIDRGEKLISLWDSLEAFFQRKVDLLTESSLRNPFLKKSIESTKVLIYDGSGRKYLSDILQSIKLIREFVASVSNYDDYVSDLKTQSAVERHLAK